jgi:hypothetical protein
MGFFKSWLGLDELEFYVKKMNDRHEEILRFVVQIEERLKQIEDDPYHKQDKLDDNLDRLNTMVNELKGVVAFVRADWNKNKAKEEPAKRKPGRPRKET